LSEALGIPWESSKTIPFSYKVPYLGFMWDLQACTMAIPSQKKEKYLVAITEWSMCSTHVLEDIQKLHGKLLHASLMATTGCAYLTSLEAMLSTFNNHPFVPHHAPWDTAPNLQWWMRTLSLPKLSRAIPGPQQLIHTHGYSDAGSGIGVAITIGNQWQAWHLVPGWKAEGRDIGWAEAVGFELLIHALLPQSNDGDHLKVYGDNWGVVKGWWKGHSRNCPTNIIF
jgi:hypothetical protein